MSISNIATACSQVEICPGLTIEALDDLRLVILSKLKKLEPNHSIEQLDLRIGLKSIREPETYEAINCIFKSMLFPKEMFLNPIEDRCNQKKMRAARAFLLSRFNFMHRILNLDIERYKLNQTRDSLTYDLVDVFFADYRLIGNHKDSNDKNKSRLDKIKAMSQFNIIDLEKKFELCKQELKVANKTANQSKLESQSISILGFTVSKSMFWDGFMGLAYTLVGFVIGWICCRRNRPERFDTSHSLQEISINQDAVMTEVSNNESEKSQGRNKHEEGEAF